MMLTRISAREHGTAGKLLALDAHIYTPGKTVISSRPSPVEFHGDIVRLYLDQTRDPELPQRALKVNALQPNWKAELLMRARADHG